MTEAKPEVVVAGEKFEIVADDPNIVTYTDRSGNKMRSLVYEGINYAFFFPLQCIKQIKGFKMRHDDVFLPGFPRTGTNWANEVTCMLLMGQAETVPGMKNHIEIMPEEELNKLPSPRVINAHVRMSEAPDDLKNKKCKVLFTLRDPKDVAVSFYKMSAAMDNEYKGSFKDYFYMFLEGKVNGKGIFDHWRVAEQYFEDNPDVPVHYHVYEEAVEDLYSSVQKLSDFLGLKRDNDLCKAIADKCQFSKLKADKDSHTVKVGGDHVIYIQGKSGAWRKHFTDEMLEDYYRVYEETMSGSRFYDLYARRK